MEGSGVTIATYVASLTSGTGAITGMFSQILTLFATEPILIISTCIFVVGAVIGLVKRLLA